MDEDKLPEDETEHLRRIQSRLEGLIDGKSHRSLIILFVLVGLFSGAYLSYTSVNFDYNNEQRLTDSLVMNEIPVGKNGRFFISESRFTNEKDYLKELAKYQRIESRINANIRRDQISDYKIKMPLFAGLGAILSTLLFVFFTLYTRALWQGHLNRIKLKLNEQGAQQLKENLEQDFFNKLVEINFKYLDQYYLQTQEQADKSFWISASAGIVGFIVMITGIIMMYTNASNVQPAYVTTASGVITEFIAAVFFYLYNRTILKMSEYHQKLVITQNISLALKTADSLDGEKSKSLSLIIDRLTQDVNRHLSGEYE
ncbi:TRADD-N-associated membrane domain-containing protein [Pedobacter kyonggii]|uniref:Cyanobacterial TRADD-N associated 2 transmembrane domain-containing protein n=1 Tax=Pedobacter kyonggii TaxID=1926871 RepID=A0A4Q9HGS3_9SPHI|nr:hypothetical protein [Pedobacter kyonggii]TBO44466.1 hypothetical protein EYS08_03940 [Pedobacter kyonggii]